MAFLEVRKVKNLHSKNSWQSWSLQFPCNKPITILLNLRTSDKYIVNSYPKVKNAKNSDFGFAKHFIGQILHFFL